MVFTLNVATVVTFATLPCALQLLLQRLAQVMTVIMISHMFLNLKGRDLQGPKDRGARSSTKRPDPFETGISLDTRVIGRGKMSSTLVGNLGNDLMRISILDHWSPDEKDNGKWAPLLHLYLLYPHNPPRPSNSTVLTVTNRNGWR